MGGKKLASGRGPGDQRTRMPCLVSYLGLVFKNFRLGWAGGGGETDREMERESETDRERWRERERRVDREA